MLDSPLKVVGQLIDNQPVAIVGSVDDGGFPNAKAMLPPRRREGLKTFYFTTNTSSRRVAQWRQRPQACLYFFDPQRFQGALLTGTMEVLEDAEHKALIWHDGDTIYYSQGVTDPDYCVLRFTAQSGRFYANLGTEDFAIPDAAEVVER